MSKAAKMYIGIIVASGTSIILYVLFHWQSQDPVRFLCYLALAMMASQMKVKLPNITGTMSVNFLFVLIGTLELSLPETLLMGCTAAFVQCVWKPKKRPRLVQIAFNVASMAIAVAVCNLVFQSLGNYQHTKALPLKVALAASAYFLANTLPVAGVISLTESKRVHDVWRECYIWSFPYYLAGAGIAAAITAGNRMLGWQTSLLVLPVLFWLYRSYRMYLNRLEGEKNHAEEIARLHLRTIEALALAIEAKDTTTHDHLRRVQVYAVEIGKEMGLSRDDLEALRAAALLHDIGKLAVPEPIISKPGKLTPEEFEKMKIHPVVGAEILERVQFPYPVVPIVRSHHEKWDGSGYPSGIGGEEIPIGARILGAVDYLDALSSDRQYRRALPIHVVMEMLLDQAGKGFDPRVVAILERRHEELEQLVQSQPNSESKLPALLKIQSAVEPAAGFQNTAAANSCETPGFVASIGAARQEVQALFELSQDLGNSLSLNETLSVVASRLKRIVSFDSIAVYLQRDGRLVPEYVSGVDFQLFSSLEIPVGDGLSGWVAQNRTPILNGNPSVEPGYLNDLRKFSTLRSALSVPLEGPNGIVGVLSLYSINGDAFMKDHLRILNGITFKLALAIENALKYREAESSATTDALTGLPNARSLFLHLDSEVSRCKRENGSVAVLVCDLDGFKQVNDRFGHLEGNRVLKIVAEGLKNACRPYDYVARMGGDEFVMVLPSQHPETVDGIMSRLSDIPQKVEMLFGERIVTISVGEAFYGLNGTDAEQLLAAADRRMYDNKQQRKRGLPILGFSSPVEWETATVH